MLEAIETPLGPMGPTEWMRGAACAGDSDLFFAPFAERPEARVRPEARAISTNSTSHLPKLAPMV